MPHADPAVRAEYHKLYKRRNRHNFAERQRAYDSAKHANQRAKKYGAIGVLTTDEVFVLLHDAVCVYCQGTSQMGIDHVEPMHSGGPNTIENVVPCCQACNASKWRGDRPGRWSHDHDRCIDCGTTERKHSCHGRCNRCNLRKVKVIRDNRD